MDMFPKAFWEDIPKLDSDFDPGLVTELVEEGSGLRISLGSRIIDLMAVTMNFAPISPLIFNVHLNSFSFSR